MKKALLTASVASMLDNFNRSNIELLLQAGYEVTLATNFRSKEDSSPIWRIRGFMSEMEKRGCRLVQVDFSRKIYNVTGQIKSYRQVKALASGGFDLVHCNSPICAALTRLAFRHKRKPARQAPGPRLHEGRTETVWQRSDHTAAEQQTIRNKIDDREKKQNHAFCGTRVIYTAHGFHFFEGSPLKNWLLYFPVEWVCSHWTDILNTVNAEDFQRAQKRLKADQVVRLPGVGIDLNKFRPGMADRTAVRRKLGIGDREIMLLSVGELISRKNHASVLKALKILEEKKCRAGAAKGAAGALASDVVCPQPRTARSLRYVICGKGEREPELKALAAKLGLAERTLFTGYREDISELCQAADLFVFPSLQEGMPMALMEAIAVNAPVICSDIRGNRELVPERELRFDPKDPGDIARCIERALRAYPLTARKRHLKDIEAYRLERVEEQMRREYALGEGSL